MVLSRRKCLLKMGGQQPVVAMKGSRMTVPETGSEGKTATSEGA